MTNANDARKAHWLVDDLKDGSILSSRDAEFLRSFLPELPAQKTLEEILEDVERAACSVTDSYWSPSLNPQDWLWELHAQLKGLKDAPVTVPALPAGMRLADHEEYGRVVVSPGVDDDGTCKIFYLSTHAGDGSDSCWAPIDSLTFIDAGFISIYDNVPKQIAEHLAYEMECTISTGDVAESAAHVDGETGRGGAIDARDSLYEMPYEWVRSYAKWMGESHD